MLAGIKFNSSPPSAAYLRRWTGPSLVQVTACRLFGAKPEPMLAFWSIGLLHDISVHIFLRMQEKGFFVQNWSSWIRSLEDGVPWPPPIPCQSHSSHKHQYGCHGSLCHPTCYVPSMGPYGGGAINQRLSSKALKAVTFGKKVPTLWDQSVCLGVQERGKLLISGVSFTEKD